MATTSARSSPAPSSESRPSSSGDAVEVVFAVDDRYAMQLGVTIRSLVQTFATSPVLPQSRLDRLSIHVIDYGISPENRARLAACTQCHPAKNITFRLIAPDITREMTDTVAGLQTFAGKLFHRDVYYTPPAMFATFSIQDFLRDVPRVIFLDADLLLRCDIRELWAADTSGHLVSAIPEYNDRLFDDTALSRPLRFAVRLCLHDQMRFQIGLDHTTFNTGVLILELDLIRRSEPDLSQRLLRQARDLMAAYDGEPVFFSDQDMISTCLRDRINALPAEWNFHDFLPRLLLRHGDYRRAMKAAKIMHYNGPPRPWEVFGKWRPFTRTWYRYLDQTPWAGWRPSIRHARLPRSKGRTLQTVVGGLILVCGRFRNHFFTEQDACLDSASQRSPGKSGLAQGARP